MRFLGFAALKMRVIKLFLLSICIPGVGEVCPASSKDIVYVNRRCPGTTIISSIRAVRAWILLLPQKTAKGFRQILLSENSS